MAPPLDCPLLVMPPVTSILFISIQLNTLQYAFYVSSRWSSFLSCLFPCFHVPSSIFLIKCAFAFFMCLRSVSILLVSASEVNNPQYICRHLLDSLYSYARSAFCTVSDMHYFGVYKFLSYLSNKTASKYLAFCLISYTSVVTVTHWYKQCVSKFICSLLH